MVHLEYKSGKQLLDEYTMKCTEAPHPNFLKSLEVFKTHVTDICELPAEYAERIIVRGISLNYGGEDDVMGCVIIAGMELQNSNAPLNTSQSRKRAQMHVCPLQLDIVERLINRYSNPGDVVLDPFGGLMTVPLVAVQKERFGIGIELSADYFRDGVGYLQTAEMQRGEPTLFDFIEQEGA